MPFGLSFAEPIVLVGLALLPALYFLLRATPPAPRRQVFPALRLLRGLAGAERMPVRMPLWLLLLRLLAAALVIIAFAGPEIIPPKLLPGSGPVLLAIDNSWASAPDWLARLDAARAVIAMAGRRGVVLFATAPDAAGLPPRATGRLDARAADSVLAAMRPQPWPAARLADAAAIRRLRQAMPNLVAVYLTDELTDGAGNRRFLKVLDPARVIGPGAATVRLLLPPLLAADGRLLARAAVVAQPGTVHIPVLSETASGRVLARSVLTVPPGKTTGTVAVDLPLGLQNRLTRLVTGGGAGGIALLDGGERLVAVGLAAGGQGDAGQKFLGSLYYLQRALPAGSRMTTGSVSALIHQGIGVLFLADDPLDAQDAALLRGWMTKGGVLIRFAGPLSAAHPDGLSPDPLLGGDRSLGGALSWTKPERIAGFNQASPLAGLPPPRSVRVTRQLLADPSRLDPASVWARLADGTPLVLGARNGRGSLVYVLTTANAAWSGWPLSAGFPAFIERLVRLARHQAPPRGGRLNPVKLLTGAGRLVAPGPAARPVQAAGLSRLTVSPAHPPGLWGEADAPVAINLGDHVPALQAAALPSGVVREGLNAAPRPRYFGPVLLAAALALLLLDMLIGLRLRGLLRVTAAVIVMMAAARNANAGPVPDAALTTSLAYVRTGDEGSDRLARKGLTAVSLLADQETAAKLGAPAGVTPGRDPLLLYPLLYWRITSATPPPDAAACRALTGFMASGGLLVADTDGGGAGDAGSGAGFDPGARTALKRALACLPVPPLRPLTSHDTLAHTFYLAKAFPGRFAGAPVYIAAAGGQDADGVSPLVIGTDDWASAWAGDAAGTTLLPGGGTQLRDADWFGVNLVMYALTGTYKSDQLQIPAILRRLSR
jgi:hypothetical protein